jgi:hypothetical protein
MASRRPEPLHPDLDPRFAVDRALDALIAVCETGALPDRESVEHVLTSGYAEALDLEAERLSIVRRLERGRAGDAPVDVVALRADLHAITSRLRVLRRRLAAVDGCVSAMRATSRPV